MRPRAFDHLTRRVSVGGLPVGGRLSAAVCGWPACRLTARRHPTRSPGNWELTHVDLDALEGELTKRGDLLRASGHLCCRPRGSWANERFPFLHLWTMCAGRALAFRSYLDGRELRRSAALDGCPTARR
jgi:hypothetical protein